MFFFCVPHTQHPFMSLFSASAEVKWTFETGPPKPKRWQPEKNLSRGCNHTHRAHINTHIHTLTENITHKSERGCMTTTGHSAIHFPAFVVVLSVSSRFTPLALALPWQKPRPLERKKKKSSLPLLNRAKHGFFPPVRRGSHFSEPSTSASGLGQQKKRGGGRGGGGMKRE